MSLSSIFPTVRPSLLLNFAKVKRLDPRITFTRSTTATYYDGETEAKAEENLLLRSQDYSATWTVTNLTPVTGKTAPDGTSTATEFTAGAANAVLTQGYTAIAGSYTFSVWLRRVTGTGDIEIAADNGTWTTKVITGTWARYDVTQTVAAGSKTAGVRVVTSGDAIEVWGAQLEQRSSVTSYTPTTTQPITNYIPVLLTAPAGVARFDHNPVTEESLGLLIEEQRTNLATYSDDFSDTDWTKTRSSIISNTIVAPDGTLTGDKLVENTDTNTHLIFQGNNTFSASQSVCGSVYLKAGERTFASIGAPSGSAGTGINLTTGELVNVNVPGWSNATTRGVIPVGNGWYRVYFVFSATGSSGVNDSLRIFTNNGTTTSYTGDGYSGIYIWGAQLEVGAFPTSYIPTVASTVTRNADVASMTGSNFTSWFNNAEGTLYAAGYSDVLTLVGNKPRLATLRNSSDTALNQNSMSLARNNTALDSGFFVNSVSQAYYFGTVGDLSNGRLGQAALAYKFNDINASFNGDTEATDTSALIPVVDMINIGWHGFSGIGFWNGWISKVAYYPERLPNEQLQALTGS